MERIAQKNYAVLDVMRMYCACLVVVLHAMELPTGGTGWKLICACFFPHAVPFFFMVSGFFLAKKLYLSEHKIGTAWKYACKQLLLYAAWSVLWLPYLINIYRNKYPDASVFKLLALLFRRIVFAGEGVYWYILVLAEGAIVIGLLLHFKKEKVLWALACVGLLLGYCYDLGVSLPGISQLNSAFYVIFSWSNNVVMMGLPFMAAGVFFAAHEDALHIRVRSLSAVYVLVSALHIVLFFVCAGKVWANGLFYPLQTVALFGLGIQVKTDRIPAKLALSVREMSAVVYFMHTVFIYAVFDYFFSVEAPVSLKFFGSIGLSLLTYAFVRYTGIKPLCWLLGMKYTAQKTKGEIAA